MAEDKPCSPPVTKRQTPGWTGIPSRLAPESIELPTSLQALIPILEMAKPQKDVSSPKDGQPLRNVEYPEVESPKKVEFSKKLPHRTAPRDRGQTAPVRQTELQSQGTAETGESTGEQRSSR
jgi:hypothetical protein